jgi:hypothetical protein
MAPSRFFFAACPAADRQSSTVPTNDGGRMMAVAPWRGEKRVGSFAVRWHADRAASGGRPRVEGRLQCGMWLMISQGGHWGWCWSMMAVKAGCERGMCSACLPNSQFLLMGRSVCRPSLRFRGFARPLRSLGLPQQQRADRAIHRAQLASRCAAGPEDARTSTA